MGASSFIRKPFRSAEVLAEIGRQVGAEYLYEESGETAGGPSTAPLPSFAAVPSGLRLRLHEAAERLDRAAVGECLAELGSASPALEAWVREKAAGYAFESILQALEVLEPVGTAG